MGKKQSQTKEPEVAPAPEQPPAPAPRKVTSLAELQQLIQKPKVVEIDLNGTKLQVEVRSLTPAEDAVLDGMLREIVPPMIKGAKMEDDRPNFNDPTYIKAFTKAETEVRALGLYWTCPMIHDGRPDLKTPKEIVEYVQGQLNVDILNALWNAVRHSGVRQAELVNFF